MDIEEAHQAQPKITYRRRERFTIHNPIVDTRPLSLISDIISYTNLASASLLCVYFFFMFLEISSSVQFVRTVGASMEDDFSFGDQSTVPPSFDRLNAGAKGFNSGLIVLLVVVGLMLVFLVGNYVLYTYAQKNLPQRKKKPLSKKKMKKERLKQGVSAPGE